MLLENGRAMEFLNIEKYTYLEEKHRGYLDQLKDFCKKSPRLPRYHIHPPCGLLNDPNGLCYFEGKYHVFYQWFPFAPKHGMKHWAHVISEDLVHWEWSEEMLVPDHEFEKNGCYSGNSIEAGGKQYLFYTANYKTKQGKVPKQALAVMEKDGKIHKYSGNPVIDGAPEGMSEEIRDPFVFEKDDSYYMMLGGSDLDGTGQILIYKSADLLSWDYRGNLDLGRQDLGTMFECPAYMEIDGKDVLLLSLIGRAAQEERFQNEFSTVCFTGRIDLEKLTFETETMEELDKGFDFYAPQMFCGKGGRPLMFGWFGCGVQELPYFREDMWQHALTLPREICIKDGRLYQMPAQEIISQFSALDIKRGQIIIPEENAWRLHLISDTECKTEIHIGESYDHLKIVMDPIKGQFIADRSCLKQKISEEYGTRRVCPLDTHKSVEVDLYYDNTFLEIYIDGGKDVMSLRLFPESYKVEMI